MPRRSLAIVLAALLVSAADDGWAAAGDLQLASRASGPAGAKGDEASIEPKLSADGRFVAFVTTATNLDPADTDATVPDVYVRDLHAGVTTLVSRTDGADAVKGNAVSDAPAISADGRYVAFVSEATNLSPDKTDDGVADVFVRDLQQHTTTLVSRSSSGEKGDSDSGSPAISADGRIVAFTSAAANLATGDTDPLIDVFARAGQRSGGRPADGRLDTALDLRRRRHGRLQLHRHGP
jgi:Tol biopolymer transport system component